MILDDRRRAAFTPLTEAGLPHAALERLAALGVTTLQELRDYWAYGNRLLLMDYLDESGVQLAGYQTGGGITFAARSATGPGNLLGVLAAGQPPRLVKRSRGLILTAEQRRRPAEAPAPVRLAGARRAGAPEVFLGAKFPPVRDQGQRGTCVAFAAAAFLEYHLYRETLPRTKHHSEQFLFWACKQIDGIPDQDGTYLRSARDVLRDRGVCLSRTWRYGSLPGATVAQGPPPERALGEALKYTRDGLIEVPLGTAEGIREALDAGGPVLLGVKTFPNWDFPSVAQTGEIPMPLPGMVPDGGHAVCVVGYELRANLPGGGAIVFRNSWGRTWARPHGRYGVGYATLAFEYVRRYGLEAYR